MNDETIAELSVIGWSLSVWSLVGGLAWPIDRCSNEDAGRRERKTPTPRPVDEFVFLVRVFAWSACVLLPIRLLKE